MRHSVIIASDEPTCLDGGGLEASMGLPLESRTKERRTNTENKEQRQFMFILKNFQSPNFVFSQNSRRFIQAEK